MDPLLLITTCALSSVSRARPSTGEWIKDVRVKERGDIILCCDSGTNTNLENETLDLRRYINSTTYKYLAIWHHDEPEQHDTRASISLNDPRSGVATTNISNAALSDSGLHQIYSPSLKFSCWFNVIVERRETGSIQNVSSTAGPPSSTTSPAASAAGGPNPWLIGAAALLIVAGGGFLDLEEAWRPPAVSRDFQPVQKGGESSREPGNDRPEHPSR
ncbi:uncharacterized protein LOC115390774 [Salarias fasciatus]|uniref:uncharacterized protein LOC115390774 n=1 Tax=Salarias fasciatus TaxID=181472 RepID=UPI0011770D37|nr:uncharacterized protein LOC115390774 [Salarias fasciatus]